jgi:hypothetical protein
VTPPPYSPAEPDGRLCAASACLHLPLAQACCRRCGRGCGAVVRLLSHRLPPPSFSPPHPTPCRICRRLPRAEPAAARCCRGSDAAASSATSPPPDVRLLTPISSFCLPWSGSSSSCFPCPVRESGPWWRRRRADHSCPRPSKLGGHPLKVN